MRESFVELGVIINVTRYRDFDARLAIYTANGVRWLGIKGVFKPKAKFAAAVGLFTIAEFTISGNTITNINVLVTPYQISKDLNRYYLACGIADALLHLEFVEQAPQALIAAINAITALAESTTSCYVIFIDFFTTALRALGYDLNLSYNPDQLTLSTAKKIIKQINDAFLTNVDFRIQFCDMMY